MKSLREHLNESLLNEVSMELIGRAHAKAKLAKERLEQILADGEANGGSIEKVSKKPVFKPETKGELKLLINRLIKERGNNADLNDIDTSLITDMCWLFDGSKFNGDISKWDVSKVVEMYGMFKNSKFNGDISKWDVSKVEQMGSMFYGSKFNGDISKWDVSKVEIMYSMFKESEFDGDISKWDVSKVEDMGYMFYGSKFNGDISKWDVSKVEDMREMFCSSKFNGDISKWNVRIDKTNMNSMFENSPLEGNEPDWYKK